MVLLYKKELVCNLLACCGLCISPSRDTDTDTSKDSKDTSKYSSIHLSTSILDLYIKKGTSEAWVVHLPSENKDSVEFIF